MMYIAFLCLTSIPALQLRKISENKASMQICKPIQHESNVLHIPAGKGFTVQINKNMTSEKGMEVSCYKDGKETRQKVKISSNGKKLELSTACVDNDLDEDLKALQQSSLASNPFLINHLHIAFPGGKYNKVSSVKAKITNEILSDHTKHQTLKADIKKAIQSMVLGCFAIIIIEDDKLNIETFKKGIESMFDSFDWNEVMKYLKELTDWVNTISTDHMKKLEALKTKFQKEFEDIKKYQNRMNNDLDEMQVVHIFNEFSDKTAKFKDSFKTIQTEHRTMENKWYIDAMTKFMDIQLKYLKKTGDIQNLKDILNLIKGKLLVDTIRNRVDHILNRVGITTVQLALGITAGCLAGIAIIGFIGGNILGAVIGVALAAGSNKYIEPKIKRTFQKYELNYTNKVKDFLSYIQDTQ